MMKNLSIHLKESLRPSEKVCQSCVINTSNEPEVVGRSERDMHLAYTEISVLGIIFMAAMVGNVMLIVVLWNRRKKLSRMYVFMLHLSLADLVVAFFQVLPQLIWDITDVFIGPDLLCRIIKFLQLVGMFASTYMIVAMTVDRFQAICYPMVTYQKRKALWNTAICASWTIAFIFSIPQAFIFSKTEIAPGIFECWALFSEPWGLQAYVTWISIAIFLVPFAILITYQVKICRTIYNNVRMKQQKGFVASSPLKDVMNQASYIGSITKAMTKTVKMTVVTVVSYILCWAPFFIVQIWAAWSRDSPQGKKSTPFLLFKNMTYKIFYLPMTKTVKMTVVTVVSYILCWAPFFIVQIWAAWSRDSPQGAVFTILMLLGNLNSCVNPWIYMYFCGHISSCIKQQKYVRKCTLAREIVITDCFNLGDKDFEDQVTNV